MARIEVEWFPDRASALAAEAAAIGSENPPRNGKAGRPTEPIDTSTLAGALGAKIREAREHAGLSQTALAERVGVRVQSISNWERGERLLPIEQARPIAVACGCPITDLIP